MTYPSQPGYPTPYGQPQPPGQRQNNLWLIGGAIVVILIIVMTVTLLLVQQNTGSDSADGGGGDGETSGETGGDDNGGDTEYDELEPSEFTSEGCNGIDTGTFEEVTGESVDPDSSSHSFSSYESYDSVSCSFYTSTSYYSMYVYLYDYETAEEVVTYIEYDDDTYANDPDYEFAEYTEHGDVGTLYSNISDPTYQTTYLHVALGSLETRISINYDESLDPATVTPALEDVLLQVDAIFADVQ
jgi:hypothetical protein